MMALRMDGETWQNAISALRTSPVRDVITCWVLCFIACCDNLEYFLRDAAHGPMARIQVLVYPGWIA